MARPWWIVLFLLPSLLLLSACASKPSTSPPQDLILDFVAAFNDKDAAGMGKMAHPDIEWLYISGNESAVMTSGREAMLKELEGHFENPRKVTSRLSGWSVNGAFISVKETASWITEDGTAKEQSSIAVYEIKDDLIRRVWYFPEQRSE